MRLDAALVAQGLARSRGQARDLIDGGRVTVNGRPAAKASLPVGPDDTLAAETDPWVSRAAHKLLGALDASGTEVAGCRALDAGASTGGFTQVLLARGAEHVTAVDVGHGQLAEPVASDPRVTSHEGLNLRDLTPAHVAAPVDLVVADVSFISLTLILPQLPALLAAGGNLLLLVKPQFEVGPDHIGKGGIVRDPTLYREVEKKLRDFGQKIGLTVAAWLTSPITGGDGNREFFIWLNK